MLSTLRAGKNICSWGVTAKQFHPRFVFGRDRATARTLFNGHVVGRVSQQGWKRCSSNEAKATVRAIPVESARAGWTSDQIGHLILGGGCLFGVGSLCYYGMGLSVDAGAIDRAGFWPKEVRERISKTYTYFASGLGITSLAAYAATQATSVMRFMATRPYASLALFFIGTIGSSMLCFATPYTPETMPVKLGTFALFTSVMGITLAPLLAVAGPLAARAALYTAGVVGGLSLTAACAPSEKYLRWSGPLSLGLGVVFVASIGGMFAAPGGVLFSGLHTIYMYGGLVLFGGFLLYDTQKIIHSSETGTNYDPVNMSIGIYLDTVNIFIRILYLLASSNSRKK